MMIMMIVRSQSDSVKLASTKIDQSILVRCAVCFADIDCVSSYGHSTVATTVFFLFMFYARLVLDAAMHIFEQANRISQCL